MHLFAITGNLGAGKSTLAVILSWYIKNRVRDLGGDIQLFANFDLTGAKRMTKTEHWYEVADAQGSMCVWDEAHRTFDSRRFSSYENILSTELLTFVRKMLSIQCFVTPSIYRLDTRIREIIEVLIFVRKIGKKGMRVDFYDFQADFGGRLGQYLHSHFIPAGKLKQIYALNLFDSWDFVSGFPMPNNERAGNAFMQELEDRHIAARKDKGLHIPRNREFSEVM
jgi:hypothetical protein